MTATVFCVTGWHFPVDFYQNLASFKNAEVFVVSHKRPAKIPGQIFQHIPRDQFLFRSNIGYDWGCYQQFLSTGIWRDYDAVHFLHDDIQIHDFGFVEETKRLLTDHRVIGNGLGKGNVSQSTVRARIPAYAHSVWKPDSLDFIHRTVRGSYFATRKDTLQMVGSFEVYWDPWKINIEFGNWSTKATCGKMEALFGPSCFGYLSDTFGRSDYITEFIRGNEEKESAQIPGMNANIYKVIKRISRVYMEILYREKELPARQAWLLGLRSILAVFSQKLY